MSGRSRRSDPERQTSLPALLLAAGAAISLLGAIAPWIPHPAAGLNVGAYDLFEISKFLPAVRSGAVSLFREGFLLPLFSAALLLALVPTFARRSLHLASWLCPAAAASIALLALPPYPAILTAHRDPEYRGQLALVACTLALSLISPLARRLPRPASGLIAAALTLGGAMPALAALSRVRPLFAELYSAPVGIGWGVPAYILGCTAALLAALLAANSRVPRQRPC